MSVITEGQRAGRGEPPPAEASERQKAVIWTMGGQLRVPHGPRRRGWGGGGGRAADSTYGLAAS